MSTYKEALTNLQDNMATAQAIGAKSVAIPIPELIVLLKKWAQDMPTEQVYFDTEDVH